MKHIIDYINEAVEKNYVILKRNKQNEYLAYYGTFNNLLKTFSLYLRGEGMVNPLSNNVGRTPKTIKQLIKFLNDTSYETLQYNDYTLGTEDDLKYYKTKNVNK